MRIVAFLCLLTSLVAADALAQRGPGRRSRASEPVELKHFSYELLSIDAPSLKSGKGSIGVYLPVGYGEKEAAETTYPLVLWLHGLNEDASRFHDGGGAKVLDQLRGDGKIPELILVAPSASSRTAYANGEGSGDAEDYILKDVVAHVEKHYRVTSDRKERFLMGVSMGGMGAMRMALKYPERFGGVAVHSSAAFPPDPEVLEGKTGERVRRSIEWLGLGEVFGDPIDPEKWATVVPSAMVGKIEPESLHGLRIFFDAGTDDRYGFAQPNEQLDQLMTERKIDHRFALIEGGGHSWGSGGMGERIETSLGFLFPPTPAAEENEGDATKGENRDL